MSGSTFSPDGQWMWTGSEWVPAPPTSPPGPNSITSSPIMVQQTELQIAENDKEIRLQQKTLQTITSYTKWTRKFISMKYRIRMPWILFLMFVIPYFVLVIFSTILDPDIKSLIVPLIITVISWSTAISKIIDLRRFNIKNKKKRYSISTFGNKSWIKQLDPMITRYEHLVNWTYSNQNAEIKRKLMHVEIEFKRLLKARRRSQALIAVAAGVAVGAAAKGLSQARSRK